MHDFQLFSSLRKSQRSVALFAGVFFIFSLVGNPNSAQAFFKKKFSKNKASKNATVSELPQYRIFFTSDASSQKEDSVSGKKSRWIELNYKVVDTAEEPGHLFEGAQGGKVRFLDKDGFMLARDYFLREDFQRTDLYGSLWVEKDRIKHIVKADALPLREGEIEVLERERQEKKDQKNREEQLYQETLERLAAASSPSPSPSPSPSESILPNVTVIESVTTEIQQTKEPEKSPTSAPQKNESGEAVPSPQPLASASASPSPETIVNPDGSRVIVQQAAVVMTTNGKPVKQVVESTKIVSSPGPEIIKPDSAKEESTQLSTVAAATAKKTARQKESDKILDLGGTTNDDIQKKLTEANEKPETVIEESPSKIPGFEADTVIIQETMETDIQRE